MDEGLLAHPDAAFHVAVEGAEVREVAGLGECDLLAFALLERAGVEPVTGRGVRHQIEIRSRQEQT